MRKNIFWSICFTCLAAFFFASVMFVSADEGLYRNESESEKNERMEWWRDARFGMFIHWGLYAIPAGEWEGRESKGYAEWIRHKAKIPQEDYDKLVESFNPVDYNPDEWVRLAKEAGMKYIVLTSKHHDGFCLWPSDLTEYDIESTPFDRDILGELKEACDKHGVKLGFYYSIMDWHHPNYPPRDWEKDRPRDQVDMDKYTKYMKGQLKELIEEYDPAVLWFDGEWEGVWNKQRGRDLYEYLRALKPDVIINNRVGKRTRNLGDFGTPEQEIPAEGIPGWDWETCMTMNKHWGWNKNDENWKSAEGLVERLVDIASKGGNYLLNVGPKPDGTFPEESVERLANIGDWMDVNGEAIYGTTASPFGKVPLGRVTAKEDENTLYLHIFDWPAEGEIELPGMGSVVKSAELLGLPGGRDGLKTELVDENLLRIHLPGDAPSRYVSVVKLKYAGELATVPYVPKVQDDSNGVFKLKAGKAETTGNLKYEEGKDCIGYWTGKGSAQWLLGVEEAGNYNVRIVWACEKGSGGTPYKIEVGGAAIKDAVAETGGWTEFEEKDLGTIKIAKGEQLLKVFPLKQPSDGVMNLRRIVLSPSKR